jgi:branched-chain amino acid transport system permease protein
MHVLVQTIKDALVIGGLYALIALGYTMVYGILKFINFAHSDIVVLGAWTSLVLARGIERFGQGRGWTSLPWWVGGVVLVGAMALCAFVAFCVERLAYKPLRNAPRINVLITAIGVSLFLQNTGNLEWLFGTRPARIPSLLPDSALVTISGVRVNTLDVVVILTAVALMLALDWLVFRTKLGRGMRAVSHSTSNAALMGVPVDRTISITFVIGAALAAAGGFLWSVKYLQISQTADASWVLLGLKAFVAAVVGGIGNIRGAMLGGLAIAIIEQFGAAYLSPALQDIYVFGLLILVLLVRPGGILGKAVVEKV